MPVTLTLHRLSRNAYATFGTLADAEERQLCVTLERPWVDNEHTVSCIPAGTYQASRYHSPKRGYDVWLLDSVPNRDMIEIHVGNVPSDTDGCILVGTHFGETDKGYGIIESKKAFDLLMQATKDADTLAVTVLEPVQVAT